MYAEKRLLLLLLLLLGTPSGAAAGGMSAGLTMEASSAFVDLGFCREKLNHDLRLSGFIMAGLKKESVCRGEVEAFIMSIVSRSLLCVRCGVNQRGNVYRTWWSLDQLVLAYVRVR